MLRWPTQTPAIALHIARTASLRRVGVHHCIAAGIQILRGVAHAGGVALPGGVAAIHTARQLRVDLLYGAVFRVVQYQVRGRVAVVVGVPVGLGERGRVVVDLGARIGGIPANQALAPS